MQDYQKFLEFSHTETTALPVKVRGVELTGVDGTLSVGKAETG
jgi:hypothetical protein